MMEQVYETTCVVKNGRYKSFGVDKISAPLYGVKVEDIIKIELRLCENQDKLKQESDTCWGWLEFETNRLNFLFNSYIQVQLCSPDFFDLLIERKVGNIVKLKIKPI